MKGAANGTIVIADSQAGGRGRMARNFYSPPGSGLYYSLIIKPRFDISKSVLVTAMAAVATARTISAVCGIETEIKWVNDLYYDGKKVVGILTEAMSDFESGMVETVIIGIGINVNQQFFPTELPNPVSLRQIVGSVQDREYILDVFMREFFLLYRDFQQGRREVIEDEYMLDLYRVNDYYWFEDREGKFQAKIEDVLPSGHLMLRTLEGDNVRRYAFKEVAFVE